MMNPFQKYFPYILILITVILGGFFLFRRGILSLPFIGNKSQTVVNIGRSSSVIDILFKGEEYKLSYADLPTDSFIPVMTFGKGEQWRGSGSLEKETGGVGTVLSLVDRDREKTISYLEKPLNLSSIDTIKFVVALTSDPEYFEALHLVFGNKDLTSFYRFPVTNLRAGVNYLTLPKHQFFQVEGDGIKRETVEASVPVEKAEVSWNAIERLQLELLSRPGGKASIEVLAIRGEKSDIFSPDWNWSGGDHFFNLATQADGKITLFVQSVGGSFATFKKLGSVKDFSFSANITSEKKGFIGLFFRGDYKSGYGYYLSVGGIGTSSWLISKLSLVAGETKPTVLLEGRIGNFEFSGDQPFWLKATVKGSNIIGYFSIDGKEYTKLGEVNDSEFQAGGVGVSVSSGAAGYFDQFYLTQK